MAYPEHWLALSTAIKSLKETGVLYASLQNARNEDSYGASEYLCERCAAVIRGLQSFWMISRMCFLPKRVLG